MKNVCPQDPTVELRLLSYGVQRQVWLQPDLQPQVWLRTCVCKASRAFSARNLLPQKPSKAWPRSLAQESSPGAQPGSLAREPCPGAWPS